MNLLDLIVGKPLKTSHERAEQIGPSASIPIFGLDALNSAASGPEAALARTPRGLLIHCDTLSCDRTRDLRGTGTTVAASAP